MMFDGELLHLLVADCDAFVVGLVDERGLNGKTGLGFGVTDTAQVLEISLKRRCSIGFHLEAPGG